MRCAMNLHRTRVVDTDESDMHDDTDTRYLIIIRRARPSYVIKFFN